MHTKYITIHHSNNTQKIKRINLNYKVIFYIDRYSAFD